MKPADDKPLDATLETLVVAITVLATLSERLQHAIKLIGDAINILESGN